MIPVRLPNLLDTERRTLINTNAFTEASKSRTRSEPKLESAAWCIAYVYLRIICMSNFDRMNPILDKMETTGRVNHASRTLPINDLGTAPGNMK